MVTHDDEMAKQVRRTIILADGQILSQHYHDHHREEPPEEHPVAAGDDPIVEATPAH
jgi:ABC-type bacteriocin/lantibiotic exporter with double-glycine peptidase domain